VQELLKDWDASKSTSWGTVEHFSRLSDSEAHAAICVNRPRTVSADSVSKSNHEVSSDKFLALKALELTDGEIVNIGDADGENRVLFVYDSKLGLWNMDRRGGNTRVRISDLLDDWLLEELQGLQGMSDAAKPYNRAREKVSSNSGINNIYSIFKDTAPVNSGIEFNNVKPKYFTWSCGKTYDFESNQFVRLRKEDYVSMTTGYPYVTPKEEDVVSLNKLYREILYEDDIYVTYMSLCATACIGTLLEKLVICTGKGGNGKGVVNELLAKMLGHYFYKGNVATLLEPIKDGGANPAIANMHNKRQTTFTEPDAGKKLNQATVKTLTGDNLINARQLYSGNMSVQNQSSIIMECNELPMISGKMDDSIKRRIVTIPFKVKYTDNLNDEDLVAGTPHVHPANLMYKEIAWQISMRGAVFEMIRRFATEHGTELIVTPQCTAFAEKYVMSSDFAMEWFKSTYEKVDTDEHVEPIKMKVLFQRFKESDEYGTLDRDDKKYWTKGRLQDHVAKKLPKTDYIAVKWEGKTKHANCIWNWRESLDM
jgi:phage/plasmid-associated DNA primase